MHRLEPRFASSFVLAATLTLVGSPARSAPTPRIAVLCKSESTLALVDPATFAVVARIPTGVDPHEVAVSEDGSRAFVANYGGQQPGSTLSVIDLELQKEIRRVDLGALRRPHGLAVVGGKVYFTAEVNNAIARYDPQADRVDWLVGTGEQATHMVVAAPDGERLYTANIVSNTISAIDLLRPQGPLVTQVPVGQAPEGIAVSPDGREVWVGHGGGGLKVIDTAKLAVTATIETPAAHLRLLFTPDGKRVLAPDVRSGDLVVYDAATWKEVKRVPVGQVPVGLTLDGEGKRVFVSTLVDDRVAVVDLERLAVTGRFEPGKTPDGIAWAGPRKAPLVAVRKRGALGVALSPLSDEMKQAQKLEAGAVIGAVGPGSAAATAGLQPGDVILSVNGEAVSSPNQVVEAVRAAYAGDVLTFQVRRDAKTLTLKATLTPRI